MGIRRSSVKNKKSKRPAAAIEVRRDETTRRGARAKAKGRNRPKTA